MFSLKKRLVSIFIFSVSAMLCSPVAAQDMKSMEKFYCPYCGMANLATSKFCGACGARLPQPLSPSTKPGLRLASTSMPRTAMINDSLGAKILYDDEVVQRYRQQGSIAGPIAGGLFAGAIGFFGGAFVGYGIDTAISDGYYDEYDGLAGLVIGAPIGESLLMPVGVHLANGRRGNLPLAMLASMGIAGTGIAIAASSYESAAIVLPLSAVSQLIACVAIERTTSDSR
jgi:hypothetical protein